MYKQSTMGIDWNVGGFNWIDLKLGKVSSSLDYYHKSFDRMMGCGRSQKNNKEINVYLRKTNNSPIIPAIWHNFLSQMRKFFSRTSYSIDF